MKIIDDINSKKLIAVVMKSIILGVYFFFTIKKSCILIINDKVYSQDIIMFMTIKKESLPYSKDSLAPYISSETLNLHHDKHHETYAVNLEKLIAGTEMESMTLVEIINQSRGKSDMFGIFNNSAQVWNHDFYFKSMHINGGSESMSEEIGSEIVKSFGSYEKFADEFKNAALTQFGAGWTWLCYDSTSESLKIIKTSNAETPIGTLMYPLATIDVWEHAYYVDYQNRRGDYIDVFLSKLLNWHFVSENLTNARSK
jgi:superoxide dismutase, Fe-Mn family